MSEKKISREEFAKVEIGRTCITRFLSAVLAVCFIFFIFAVPVTQYVVDWRNEMGIALSFADEQVDPSGTSFFATVKRKNKIVLKNLHLLETSLEEGSLLRKIFLPPLQYVFFHFLGQANERVVFGRDGWLFLSSGVDYLIGRSFLDPYQIRKREESHEIWEEPVQAYPIKAIVDFKDQLAQRGIKLILIPLPTKASIQPEKLSLQSLNNRPVNRAWPGFIDLLEKNGVDYFDVRPVLTDYRTRYDDAFLVTDTHWSPGAMQTVAARLAGYIEKKTSSKLRTTPIFRLQRQIVTGDGDLAKMLTLPEMASPLPVQQVEIAQVITEDAFWQPDPNAEILLLGDSFTNIYSVAGLGWGIGAGFAEHLSYNLQQSIDLIAINDGGAYLTREILATELGRGRDRLAGKKMLVWQFSERELALGDWKQIDLRLGEIKKSLFYVAQPGESLLVTGMVAAISRSPRPGSVPYRDNIITLHLVDLYAKDRTLESDQALVYGWGMRDNRRTGLSSLRVGATVSLVLSSWEEVEGEYGSYRRTPLDDETMELELPNWTTGDTK